MNSIQKITIPDDAGIKAVLFVGAVAESIKQEIDNPKKTWGKREAHGQAVIEKCRCVSSLHDLRGDPFLADRSTHWSEVIVVRDLQRRSISGNFTTQFHPEGFTVNQNGEEFTIPAGWMFVVDSSLGNKEVRDCAQEIVACVAGFRDRIRRFGGLWDLSSSDPGLQFRRDSGVGHASDYTDRGS